MYRGEVGQACRVLSVFWGVMHGQGNGWSVGVGSEIQGTVRSTIMHAHAGCIEHSGDRSTS